jgi:hypothetical protein
MASWERLWIEAFEELGEDIEAQSRGAKSYLESLGTHTPRHTDRSWIDSVGTSVAVQQKLMRNSDIRTTMHVSGDVVDDRTQEA